MARVKVAGNVVYVDDVDSGVQGGRSWQPFDEGRNGQKNRQAHIYYFCDVVLACKCKFANLTL